jgi:exodeoxyribonuclease-3
MKIIAWNVNGLRSLIKRDHLINLINDRNPDILCLGETKMAYDKKDIELLLDYKYKYWSHSTAKSGYSGTAIFCKKEPINVTYGLSNLDNEGRVITIELTKIYLVHVYTPNSGEALHRLKWRTEVWDRAFENYINHLQLTKPVIICGDLNVAHKEIDLKNPKTNLKTAGFTIEERESFSNILNNCNLIDSFRYLYPDKIEYSYWSYIHRGRDKNIGWRLDYFLVSKKLIKKVKSHIILTEILGSDHAPIELKI